MGLSRNRWSGKQKSGRLRPMAGCKLPLRAFNLWSTPRLHCHLKRGFIVMFWGISFSPGLICAYKDLWHLTHFPPSDAHFWGFAWEGYALYSVGNRLIINVWYNNWTWAAPSCAASYRTLQLLPREPWGGFYLFRMKPALFAHKTENYYTLICRSLQERVYFLKISHESGRFVDCKASELSSVN